MYPRMFWGLLRPWLSIIVATCLFARLKGRLNTNVKVPYEGRSKSKIPFFLWEININRNRLISSKEERRRKERVTTTFRFSFSLLGRRILIAIPDRP